MPFGHRGVRSSGANKGYDPYADPGERQEDYADKMYATGDDSRDRRQKNKEAKEKMRRDERSYDMKQATFQAGETSKERRDTSKEAKEQYRKEKKAKDMRNLVIGTGESSKDRRRKK